MNDLFCPPSGHFDVLSTLIVKDLVYKYLL